MSWLGLAADDLWSLLGAAGAGGLGLLGRALGGWRGYLAAFLAGAGLTLFATLKVVGWQGAAEERDRLRWQLAAERLTAAGTQAARAAELADRDRALAAAEAAAEAAADRTADLETLLKELRHAPPEDDKPLSPTAQRFFDGLRE